MPSEQNRHSDRPGGHSRRDEPLPEASQDVDDPAVVAELDEVRRAILSSPPEAVMANHCYGMFELAAMHLSQQPPSLDAARLAIDGLAALTEALSGRLGPDEETLREGLAQLRLAWVQVGAAHSGSD